MTNERAKDILECHLNDLKKKMPYESTVITALEVAISQLWDERSRKMSDTLYEEIKQFILEHGLKEFMIVLSQIIESIEEYL